MGKGNPEHKTINRRITEAIVDLTRHFDYLTLQHDIVTPQMVKNVYSGKPATDAEINEGNKEKEELTLLDAFEEYIKRFEKLVEKKRNDTISIFNFSMLIFYIIRDR